MSKTVWRYGVQVRGIKKRCRKVDRHWSNEPLKEVDAPDKDEAYTLARQWAKDNMKTVETITATAKLWTIDGIGEHWEPFTDEHNLSWKVEL